MTDHKSGGKDSGGGLGDGGSSKHPTDRLIRELISDRRKASEEEVRHIIARIAEADLATRKLSVPLPYRGKSYQGRTLGRQESALLLHLVQRVILDKQWAFGTTATEFIADLRQAVRDPAARVALYLRRGSSTALFSAPNILPPNRLGANAKKLLVVIFNADFGKIASGYQVDDLHEVSYPGDALWLK